MVAISRVQMIHSGNIIFPEHIHSEMLEKQQINEIVFTVLKCASYNTPFYHA
jgi:hypothetical protein